MLAIGNGLRYRCFLGVGLAVRTHRRLRVHEVIHGNAATLGDLVVVEIMRASNFHRTRAEILVRIFIRDDRDQAAQLFRANRNFAELTDDRGIAFVRWMHRNCAITQHRFRTRSGNGDIVARFAQRLNTVFVFLDILIGRTTRERVLEVPHVASHFDILDLKIGNRCFKMRIPVHQTLAAIDETFVIHLHEDLDHGIMEVALCIRGRTGGSGHGEGFA